MIYRYDENGIRVYKETNNLKTKYTVLGTKILHINKDILVSGNIVNKDGHFIYDEHNLLEGLTIDDKEYYYIRDITGNINKIVDTSNTVMIQYTYDAWG